MSQKRREFLKSLGLASVGLTLPFSVTDARPAPLISSNDFSPVALNGKVSSQGRGIQGVAVTDGSNVVLTDLQGNYVLQSNSIAEFVHISLPRGYAFPHAKGMTRFFRKIEVKNGRFEADFELQKLPADDTRHAFVVWADPQILTKEDAEQLKLQSAPDTRRLIDSYGSSMLFHGIGCGDLVWDKFELFDDYKQAFGATGIPFFQVIGNHDMDLDARTDDHSAREFKKHFGPTYYSFNRGEIHYVVLDDVFFLGTSKRYIGYIAENQFAWLEQDLAHIKPGSTVVVCAHIPVNTGVKRRYALSEEPIAGVVSNRHELYRILKPYKAHIMTGHTHFNEKVFEGENIIEHVHGTVCGAWWTGPICYDGTPGGYGVYEVSGGDIKWYYKSVGHDRNHQLRIYPVGAIKEKPDQLVVNVWNWDPEWKVEWMEDGKNKGEMQRDISVDPLSVELHLGADKPSKHGWVEPVLTDHMFFATPSSSAKRVTVRVTDRFSNVFTEEINLTR